MSYLVVIPCIAVVCVLVARLELRVSTFALLTLLLITAFASLQWFTPGVDVLIASSLSMAVANLSAWFIDTYATKDEPTVDAAPRYRRFCSLVTHDYAVSPGDSVFAISLINSGAWQTLQAKLVAMTDAERQGFFANLNYSSVSERALQAAINDNPKDADSHILMGHVKLCLAKRLGLQPGSTLNEPVASAIAQAFKHFNLALRINPNDSEALCGLIMAKGFSGLGAEHLLNSLTQLLKHDPQHFHGVIAAARFLVVSTPRANEFIATVESAVEGRSEVTVAIAKIITHIECMGFVDGKVSIGASNSQVVADLYRQLRSYQQQGDALGRWQKGIADNIVAYMLQLIDDKKELNRYLKKIDGSVSPYPWQSNTIS